MPELIWDCRCGLCLSTIDLTQVEFGCCGECGTRLSEAAIMLIKALVTE